MKTTDIVEKLDMLIFSIENGLFTLEQTLISIKRLTSEIKSEE